MTDNWSEPSRLSVIEEEPKTPDSPTLKTADDHEDIRKLLKEKYGLLVVDIWPLPSVLPTDLTYKVKGNMAGVIQEFTFKQKMVDPDVESSADSSECVLQFQIMAMSHVREHHILCPRTVPDGEGKLLSIISSRGLQLLTQLTTYIKGTPLSATKINPANLFDVGVLLATLRNSFRTFSNPLIKEEPPKEIWRRENFKQLLHYLSLLKDESQRQLVENIILAFCQDFEQKIDRLETGFNHGDLHPANIVLTKTDETLPILERYGIIDFALVNFSFQMLDLSVALVLFTTMPVQDILKDDYSYVGNVARQVGPQLKELWQTPQKVVMKMWNDKRHTFVR